MLWVLTRLSFDPVLGLYVICLTTSLSAPRRINSAGVHILVSRGSTPVIISIITGSSFLNFDLPMVCLNCATWYELCRHQSSFDLSFDGGFARLQEIRPFFQHTPFVGKLLPCGFQVSTSRDVLTQRVNRFRQRLASRSFHTSNAITSGPLVSHVHRDIGDYIVEFVNPHRQFFDRNGPSAI